MLRSTRSKQGSGCGRAMRFNDKNAILKFIEENPDANGIDIRDIAKDRERNNFLFLCDY